MEAFQEYLGRLNDDGLVMMRLYTAPELVRAFVTAVSALAGERGPAAAAARHLVAVTDPALQSGPEPRYPVLLVKGSPFTAAEARRVVDGARRSGFDVLFAPYVKEGAAIASLAHGVSVEVFVDCDRSVDLSPPRDDRPFFHHLDRGLPAPVRTLAWWLAALVGLGIAVSPAIASRGAPQVVRFALFFAALGAGFMVLEVTLVQRLILLLGHPTTAVATTVSAMFVFAGLGGLLAGCVAERRLARLVTAAPVLLAAVTVGHAFVAPALLAGLAEAPVAVRVGAAVISVLPLGCLLGLPFPAGLRLLAGRGFVRLVPFMWGVNGLAAVAGAAGAMAMAVAMAWGFNRSMLAGAACYVVAGIALAGVGALPAGTGREGSC